MRKNSFTAKVLNTINADIGPETVFAAKDVGLVIDVKTYTDIKKIPGALDDMAKRHVLVRVARGRFRLPQPGEFTPKEPIKRDRMWSIIRMRGTVTAADLEELCEVSQAYAKEYLRLLESRGILRRLPRQAQQPCKYQLLKRDLVTPPNDTLKAEKLRALRLKKKLAAAAALSTAIAKYYQTASALHAACDLAIAVLEEEG